MSRTWNWSFELLLFVGLVALGCLARAMLYEHYPNFSAVAAIALFAGYAFRSTLLAVATPVCIMSLSNAWLNLAGYDHWVIMASVYLALVAPVALRSLAKRFPLGDARLDRASAALVGLAVCGAGSSVLFFVVTNFAHWACTTMYAHTATGLAQCYVQALPFFRYTLTGDLVFALGLFGSAMVCTRLSAAEQPRLSKAAA